MNPLENRIPPPLVMLAFGFFMWAASLYLPHIDISNGLRSGLVIVFCVLGAGCLITGRNAFVSANTTINPVQIEKATNLVTGGIFQYSRNPMYVGFTLLLIGWVFYLASPWALIGPLLFALFIARFQIMPEERVLETKFGDAYSNYKASVRRWL